MANPAVEPGETPVADSRTLTVGTDRTLHGFAIAALAILALRVMGLMASPLGLHPDEAQYWSWSRTFDWGYFSKPPLVAWAIGATTAVFGDAPWAVRLAAPLAHTGAAFALFALARRMYGDAAAVAAGLGWLLIPGVWLSSALISTDALLLPLWSLALLATWRWTETRSMRWALLAGLAIGLGALAKYAMLYFPLCLALAAIWSPRARPALLSRQGLASLAVAAAIVTPNIAWNAANDFETVAHTAANAEWRGDLFNIDQLAAFLADQFAIAGLLAGGLVWLIVEFARGQRPLDERARFLLAFVAPPLAIIIVQALISRAHGNWAASAYPAAIVLVAGRFAGGAFLRWTTRTHAALFAVFLALVTFPAIAYRTPVIGRGIENGLKRMAGWKQTARLVAERAQAGDYTAVLVDHRHAFFELAYEWRDRKDLPPVRIWVLRAAPGNHAEATAPMTPAFDGDVLVVQMSPRYEHFLAADFARFTPLKHVEVALGPRKTRVLGIAEASGFKPAARDDAFMNDVGD
ncbi:MAG: glycosyltransferase family 39 protein [Hyphomonadaceae bacterium]|nr:MAG: glycosyl transferase family protein [Caulobacteraceae bacterium]MBT9446251.1 glycosyltransferase family 39 protein [Hyphomonadaceae bacterium]TPW07171.1 MAG: glycosyl transferase family protein [Alphaproteobacteria bacterium]